MLGGNNDVKTAKESSVSYSREDAYVMGIELGESRPYTNTARNWLDGIYGEINGNSYTWKNGKETKIKYPVFAGTTYSMNYIDHNDSFLLAKEISKSGNPYGLPVSADSHLMKDSEWGAVSYLAQSKYGLNGENICINNVTLDSGGQKRESTEGKTGVDSVYAVTGLTSKAVVEGTSEEENNIGKNSLTLISEINEIKGNTPTNIGEVYTWNQKSGQGASSTGTIYGIYDLSGGVLEQAAAYIANDNVGLTLFGKSLLYNESKTDETSTKYTTVYAHDSDADTGQNNYEMEANMKKFGNAIHETSTDGNDSNSWYNDQSDFLCSVDVFSIRGFTWSNNAAAGLFAFGKTNGSNIASFGFRAVLVGV